VFILIYFLVSKGSNQHLKHPNAGSQRKLVAGAGMEKVIQGLPAFIASLVATAGRRRS
jgi:hypothetical protein